MRLRVHPYAQRIIARLSSELHVRVAPPEREANSGWLGYREWFAERPLRLLPRRGHSLGIERLNSPREVGGAFLQRDEKAVHALIESAAYPLVLRREVGMQLSECPAAAGRIFGPMG